MRAFILLAAWAALCAGTQFEQQVITSDSTWSCQVDASTKVGAWGSFNISINSPNGGGSRWALIHIPPRYNPATPSGLIVSYHGNGKNALYQESLSQFSNITYNPDWFAVYPQGIKRSWYGAPYHPKSLSDDLAFTSDLLECVQSKFSIDKSRIYANGKSNGGGFVGTLACDPVVGANFAAFAPVSGAFYTDVNDDSNCIPARQPLPILEFHGYLDCTIPYHGKCPKTDDDGGDDDGDGDDGDDKCTRTCDADEIVTPDIPSWLARWAGRNIPPDHLTAQSFKNSTYMKPHPSSRRPIPVHVHQTWWTCPDGRQCVQGYNISDLHHLWPSPYTNGDNRGKVTVIDATAIIMQFFTSFTKPA